MRHREFKSRARRINERTPLGLILLLVGGALLARQLGVLLPPWIFTWPMLLVTIGVIIGFAHGFRDTGWLVITAVGVFFLMDDVYPGIKHYVWPAVIILLGLLIILRPSRKKKSMVITDTPIAAGTTGMDDASYAKEDALDVVAVFGSVKKVMLSKNFRGGEVVSVLGGAEINLMQADFKSPIKIEVVAVFGGTRLIVPANWEVRSEATAILGGIDDKREPSLAKNPDKVIILDGTAICGGIEINSY